MKQAYRYEFDVLLEEPGSGASGSFFETLLLEFKAEVSAAQGPQWPVISATVPEETHQAFRAWLKAEMDEDPDVFLVR